MNTLTKQEIFDRVVNYARTMTYRSMTPNEKCKYRLLNDSGEVVNKCFIGALIPDKLYKPTYENKSILLLLGAVSAIEHLFDNDRLTEYLLIELQNLHDNTSISMKNWESSFYDIAKRYKLIYTPPVNEE